MRLFLQTLFGLALLVLMLASGAAPVQAQGAAPPAAASSAAAHDYGIAVKRPVFAGACKTCPWGVLGIITQEAMKPFGYDVKLCMICATNLGPREVADKSKPIPLGDMSAMPELGVLFDMPPPDAAPDFGANSEVDLVDAWNGTGPYAKDNKKRQNLRVIAAVQQSNFLAAAASKRSGITSLSQIKDRKQPTWIAVNDENTATMELLAFYGITEEALKKRGGGFMGFASSREMRATADVFVGNGLLVNTPEQQLWYQASQLSDLVFLDIDEKLLDKLAQEPGYVRAMLPLGLYRGVDRPIPTVMRSTHMIFTRADVPDSFAYAVAKALDQHHDLFRMYNDPWYYDADLVAVSKVVPLHPGALKYYRERGYIK